MSAPKRVRQTGSFSPASPPYYVGAKVANSSYSPQTPTSPPLMSSATQTQPYDSSNPTNHSTSDTQPTASTPTTSIGGHVSFAKEKDGDGDTLMSGDATAQAGVLPDPVSAPISGGDFDEHRRTDHDRQGERYSEPGKSGRAPHRDDDGRFYKLLQYPHPPVRPSPSQNLIALYGLNSIAESVRRYDPVTGLKIDKNKLRKSYEGKLKGLHIAGKIKEKGKDKDQALSMPGLFRGVDAKGEPGMLSLPAENWYAQKVAGNDIMTTDIDLAVLDAALKMAPGRLPDDKAQKYVSLIGLEESTKAKNLGVDKMKKAAEPSTHSSAAGTPAPEPTVLGRSSRGIKRSYKDSSFVGYGEGFNDEESDATDADSKPLKKPRLKV